MNKTKKVLKQLALATFCSMLGTSCISDKKIVYLQGAEQMYAVPQQIEQAFELKIESDDELAISVASKNRELIEPFNNTTLIGSGTNGTYASSANLQSGVSYFLVDKKGQINFPIFGLMEVRGKTCRQLSDEIQQRLIAEGHILDAVVNTKVMSFKVTVLGDVKNAGTQTFTGERLTVLEAIGKAGDMNSSAKRDHVLVVREENGKRVTYDINMRDPKSIFESPAYYLQQNDVVYVQPNKSVRLKGSTGYSLLSVGSTVVGMIVSIVSLIVALKK